MEKGIKFYTLRFSQASSVCLYMTQCILFEGDEQKQMAENLYIPIGTLKLLIFKPR